MSLESQLESLPHSNDVLKNAVKENQRQIAERDKKINKQIYDRFNSFLQEKMANGNDADKDSLCIHAPIRQHHVDVIKRVMNAKCYDITYEAPTMKDEMHCFKIEYGQKWTTVSTNPLHIERRC